MIDKCSCFGYTRPVVQKIYTKTGDSGETGLFGGLRLPKDALRVEAYGTVDELNTVLGVARALGAKPELDGVLAELQALLFELGAELATSPGKKPDQVIGVEDVERLETLIDSVESRLAPLRQFILPGGHVVAASLHQARAICRRTERLCVRLRREQSQTSTNTIIFLNRLGDLLFVLARWANKMIGVEDVPWQPRHRS